MRTNDLLLLALLGVVLYWFAQRAKPSTAPPAFAYDGMLPPDVLPASIRNVPIANQTVQPPFQGGYRSPTTLDDVILDATDDGDMGFPIF